MPVQSNSNAYHFFLNGTSESLCGRWRLREMGGLPERRPPGKHDCSKCEEIREELFRNPLPEKSAGEPEWTVKTDREDGSVHRLFYQGKEQGLARGPVGLKTLRDTAEIANRTGAVPKKKARAKCAADAPDPGKFLAKKSNHSPELPLPLEAVLSRNAESKPPIQPRNTTAMSESATATANHPAPAVFAPEVFLVPANKFRRYPTNRTPKEEKIQNMSVSVREVGVLQPVLARPIEGTDEYELIAGETRQLGCHRISPDFPVPAFIHEIDDKEAAKLHSVENFQREDLNDIEEGREIRNMMDHGWTIEEIMEHVGKAKDYLYKRLQLLKLPEAGQAAFLDGNLSLNTVNKVMSLPEEVREDAIKAVSEPTHAAAALPEKEALRVIQEKFVLPLEEAKKWEERKDVLMKENPGCVWLEYKHAKEAEKNYTRASYHPGRDLLSDAAVTGELVVPKWEVLARKHGAPIYIGLGYHWEDTVLYVSPDAIVEAEKAAFDDKPEECIFVHEKAVQQNKDAAARRKQREEEEREKQAASRAKVLAERRKAADLVLSPDGVNKTTIKKLVDLLAKDADDLESAGPDRDELANLFGTNWVEGEEDAGDEAWIERTEVALEKYLRSKSLTPLEALGRIMLAAWVSRENWCGMSVCQGFETGFLKPNDFPELHKEHLEQVAEREEREAEEAREEAEENQRRADAIAAGEDPDDPRAGHYTDAQKAEVVRFVNAYNADHGKGGQREAAEKFNLSQLTVAAWLKAANVAVESQDEEEAA